MWSLASLRLAMENPSNKWKPQTKPNLTECHLKFQYFSHKWLFSSFVLLLVLYFVFIFVVVIIVILTFHFFHSLFFISYKHTGYDVFNTQFYLCINVMWKMWNYNQMSNAFRWHQESGPFKISISVRYPSWLAEMFTRISKTMSIDISFILSTLSFTLSYMLFSYGSFFLSLSFNYFVSMSLLFI